MIAEASTSTPLGMTPGQAIAILQRDLGLTTKDLQAVLDTTPRNIERWIQEQAHPQMKARQQLAQLMDFHRHLDAMFTDWEGAREWLGSPSRYLGANLVRASWLSLAVFRCRNSSLLRPGQINSSLDFSDGL
jgi:hypothetical protein